jgi:hypothetical protein
MSFGVMKGKLILPFTFFFFLANEEISSFFLFFWPVVGFYLIDSWIHINLDSHYVYCNTFL